jgi:hypothetical protein
MPDRTAATGGLASQRSTVTGGSVAASASFSGPSEGQMPPSGPASSSLSRSSSRQLAHWPGRGLSAQSGKTGTVHSRERGSVSVPDPMSLAWPQPAHRASRALQGGHHGSPVSRESPRGRLWPQTEHSSTGSGGQQGQSGPSGLRVFTGRRRPQFTQTSRLTGSLIMQFAQTGRPWPSLVTGSRTAPQRPHGSARECAMQVRQTRTPSRGLSMRTMRPQRPHDGRTMPATPASQSISMNPGIARSGARCAPTVSSAGFSSSAHASFCWYEGRGAERRTASATVPLPVPGSRAATMAWITVTGPRRSSSGHSAHRGRPARSLL